ncbi:MAG: response regulator [Methanobacteriaceae archaeon]|nr:response regulator [Methanobacteriaceae archaeon]MDP2836474.1 response regulator [Methanobacteriaceae archaeon]MDP3034950.1 response regulator [Methanobacteriaceae archaeon]MDP3485378.1 response regulator [Methanobacteriaceae archaeon]MDP3623189.1 response regulator [Methanobacteriaceae archaeon]
MTENVLIVEDDGIFAMELQRKIKSWGYEVPKIALSGQEALKRVEYKNTDLIIMDISLKGELDGISAAKAIEDHFDIPIVFYSSHDDDELLNKIKTFKNGDFVSKTCRDEDLKLSIENLLKKGGTMEKTVENIQNISESPIDIKEGLGDYYKAHEVIEKEFKKLEDNFSKVYGESVSQEREIESLKKAEEKYMNIISEKDEKLAEMGKIQRSLEEKINKHKQTHQKLLKETEDLKKHMNSVVSILNGE